MPPAAPTKPAAPAEPDQSEPEQGETGESFDGVVAHVGEIVDPQSRTVKVRCTVPNADHRLKPEMFAKVDLQNTGGKTIVSIPAKASDYWVPRLRGA